MFARTALIAAVFGLAGCASTSPEPPVVASDWQDVRLPGKQLTHYGWGFKDGQRAIAAVSDRSASMWRRRVEVAAADVRQVSFSWWVQQLIEDGSVADAKREDAAARVLFSFQGDVGSLPMHTRALFDLAEAITGERPPFATLMYVWDATAPVGSVIHNPRSDRIRKIVVDSGPTELRRWRHHRRDLAADFRLAFGEAPGRLTAIAIMTDSDNTQSRAQSWYGAVELH